MREGGKKELRERGERNLAKKEERGERNLAIALLVHYYTSAYNMHVCVRRFQVVSLISSHVH